MMREDYIKMDNRKALARFGITVLILGLTKE
jgi:hypothetical protein